jgi:hypothetical protein
VHLEGYVNKELDARVDAPVAAPPPDVTAWLESHAEPLDALEHQIVDGGPLVWGADYARLFAAPLPALSTHRDLGQVLLARALHGGRGAPRALDALWRLSEAFRERPQTLAQFTAFLLQRSLLDALRRTGVSSGWDERLRGLDLEASFVECLRGNAWTSLETARTHPPSIFGALGSSSVSPIEMALGPFERPYARFAIAHDVDVVRRSVAILRTADPCLSDPDGVLATAGGRTVRSWPGGASVAVRGWSVMLQRRLEIELTIEVLHTRARSAPPAVSAVCREAHWERTAGPDGLTNIHLDRPLAIKGARPIEYAVAGANQVSDSR